MEENQEKKFSIDNFDSETVEKIRQIRFLISDVDNVLTDGMVYYSSNGIDSVAIHVHDGSAVKLLQQGGIKVGLISGRKSEAILKWAQAIGVEEVYIGYLNKLIPYEQIKNKYGLTDVQIAYLGDDLTDLSILSRVGFPIAVSTAVAEVKEKALYITKTKAGCGALREVTQIILAIQGKWEKVLAEYKK
jgi:3-deoxy-D-manno-octulosonate 8-phosphate phosphatase (KDO 8-P phosphatase)